MIHLERAYSCLLICRLATAEYLQPSIPFPQEERLRAAKEKGLIGVNAGKRLRARLSSYQQALRDIQEGGWHTDLLQPSSLSPGFAPKLSLLYHILHCILTEMSSH